MSENPELTHQYKITVMTSFAQQNALITTRRAHPAFYETKSPGDHQNAESDTMSAVSHFLDALSPHVTSHSDKFSSFWGVRFSLWLCAAAASGQNKVEKNRTNSRRNHWLGPASLFTFFTAQPCWCVRASVNMPANTCRVCGAVDKPRIGSGRTRLWSLDIDVMLFILGWFFFPLFLLEFYIYLN